MRTMTLAGACALAAALMSAASAQAMVTTLSLSGVVSSGTYNSFIYNGMTYHTYSLDLGLGGAAPFTLQQGDEIQATIAFDSPLLVPAAGEQFLGLNFNGATDPTGAAVSGTFQFSGLTGMGTNPVDTNCGNCLSSLYSQSPGGGYSFTGLYADTSILTLTGPFVVNDVSISYQLSSNVPEPAAWTLMMLGLGAVGGALRGRRGRTASPIAAIG